MRVLAAFFLVLCALAGVSASSHEAARNAMMKGVMSLRQHASDLSLSVHNAVNSAQFGMSASHLQLAASRQSAAGFHSMAQPSGTCVNAVLTLNATANSASCATFIAILNVNDFAQSSAQLTTLCSSTCLQSLVTAAASVAVSCQTADAAALTTEITQLITFTNLICTKDPADANKFCVTEFFTATQSIGSNVQTVTNAQLQSICTPCTFTILNGLASYGAVPANVNSTISLICSTDPSTGNFCIVEVLNSAKVFATFSANNIPQISNADFAPLCSPCGKRFALVANTGLTANQLDALCVKNGNDFCFVKDINAISSLQSASGNGCGTFSSFINTVGCCINALGSIDPTIITDLNTFYQQCNVNNPGTCPMPTYTGTFTFVILNLAFSFYQQNSGAVNAAIISDLSLNLGVAPNQITINSVVAVGNSSQPIGVKVTVTITFSSALTSGNSQLDFNANTKAGNFPLTTVAQLGPSSRIAPANPVNAATTGASSSVTGGSTSQAVAQASFSSLVLVAAAFIALLFNTNNF